MRREYDRQLEDLNNMLIKMGALIENAISTAVEALIKRDTQMARSAVEDDRYINEMEKEIESHCLKLILHQQPIAGDLRMISTALKMITDMERIGDQAADISEITQFIVGDVSVGKLQFFPDMAQATSKMVSECIKSYVHKDLELAQKVIAHDDVVDELFSGVKNMLIEMIHDNKDNGEQALDLLMIAKYFERIGDHAVNIAEWVIFSITGQHKHTRIL
jgi:phosphate transport system protein